MTIVPKPNLLPMIVYPIKCFRQWILLLILCGFTFAVTGYGAERKFEISAEGQLNLFWKGRSVLVSDLLQAQVDRFFEDREGYEQSQVGDWEVHNLWKVENVESEVTYRREVATNGKEVELTMQYRVPAYYYQDKPEELNSFYRVGIPLESIRGMKFSARMQSGTGTVVHHGVIEEKSMKKILGGRMVYLTLEDQEGDTISFDFGPAGLAVFNTNVNPSTLPASWWGGSVTNGEALRFSIGRFKHSTYPYHGMFLGKIRISGEGFGEWEKRHLHHRYRYYMELYASRQFALGAGNLNTDWLKSNRNEITETEWLQRRQKDLWLPVGRESFSEWNSYGWENPEDIRLMGDVGQGVLHGWATGGEENTFRVRVSEPGVYVFTVRIGHVDTEVGPFALTVNEEVAAEGLTMNPGEIRNLTFSRYLEEGEARLHFSGNWAVSTIALQPLLTQREDYVFQRGLWLDENIPAPTTMFQFERRPVPGEAAVHGYPAQFSGERTPEKIPTFVFDPYDPATEWRWTNPINALGPGNAGSFYEFETEEAINRRLDELESSGFRTLLLNGLLIRHAFPEEHERIQRTVTLIARLAHQRGMKVLDHFDLTVVPNMGAAFQQYVENIEWALRDVCSAQVTRGYCINNPNFLNAFLERTLDYVKETNIDGLMLDEVSFHEPVFCGCEHCRTKFYHDTGLTLPVDEISPDLLNSESRLWNQWLLWRTERQPDFPSQVMAAIQKFRPDFVWMRYGAPITYTSSRSAQRTGSHRNGPGGYSNYMGIETIGGNIHVRHRFNMVSGLIYSGRAKPYQVPTYILIYPSSEASMAYAGWIMGNMHGQLLWLIGGNKEIEADSRRYLDWKDNMDIRSVRPVADAGVFYSLSSRDFSRDPKRFEEEIIGMCQQLDDLHLPYQVLFDPDFTFENLKQYPLIILPGVSAIRDEQLEIVREYILQGGKVLATGYLATEDEIGFAREQWPVGSWLNVSLAGEINGKLQLQGNVFQESVVQYEGPSLKVVRRPGDTASAIHATLDQQGNSAVGIVSRTIGKGLLVWAVPGLGAANYEADGRVGQLWNFRENRKSLDVLQRLLNATLGDSATFHAVQIPEAVKMRLYRSHEAAQQTYYIHLYNATGGVVREQGKTMSATPPKEVFPALDKELIMDLRLPEGKQYQAEWTTPDYPGKEVYAVKEREKGRYRINMPGKALQAYGILRIQKIKESDTEP